METNNQTTETTQTTQAPAVTGGPGISDQAATQSTEVPKQNEAQSQSNPVIIGSMKFNSMDEAGRYLSELKGKTEVIDKLQSITNPQPAIQIDPDAEIADLMFEDPKTAIKVLKQQAKEEAKKEIDVERQKERAWDKFYKDNPDLKDFDELVQATLTMKYNDIKNMPLDEAIKSVALQTRSTLAKVRGSSSSGTPLPSKPAMVAGSSGAVLPQQPAPRAEPISFVAQLSALKNRGRKGA